MKLVKSINYLNKILDRYRSDGFKIHLTPTMGALHAGHLKLVKRSKKLNIGSMQSPILARALYFTCDIGEEILDKLYNAVAIALAYIYKIDNGENIEKPEIEVPKELIFDEFGNKDV